ncbi:hypothetical protein VMF7928_02773 [Vibrio marisflavi CECT 7928]|uniref:ATP-binding protein n=1 Tax=Vibrio marisflavi CECT 7928 TaxID=634439 RepID=A0ABN8E5A0_9VIBR|nr:hypothetical protein VMF7928_02773 [Vibrio marisflavi CECT 7928]
MTNSTSKQKGNFTIEFAVVGVALALLLVFSMDVIVKLAYKGKLDRLSYSLVNVAKERTQLYGEDFQMTEPDATALFNIASNSLRRTAGSFELDGLGMVVEGLTFSGVGVPNNASVFELGNYDCRLPQNIGDLQDLSVVTSWGRQARLYRVTICYETENLFGRVLGGEFTRVRSSSVIVGR